MCPLCLGSAGTILATTLSTASVALAVQQLKKRYKNKPKLGVKREKKGRI